MGETKYISPISLAGGKTVLGKLGTSKGDMKMYSTRLKHPNIFTFYIFLK